MTLNVKPSRYCSATALERIFSTSLTFSVCINQNQTLPNETVSKSNDKSNEKSPISCTAALSENNKIVKEGIREVISTHLQLSRSQTIIFFFLIIEFVDHICSFSQS